MINWLDIDIFICMYIARTKISQIWLGICMWRMKLALFSSPGNTKERIGAGVQSCTTVVTRPCGFHLVCLIHDTSQSPNHLPHTCADTYKKRKAKKRHAELFCRLVYGVNTRFMHLSFLSQNQKETCTEDVPMWKTPCPPSWCKWDRMCTYMSMSSTCLGWNSISRHRISGHILLHIPCSIELWLWWCCFWGPG